MNNAQTFQPLIVKACSSQGLDPKLITAIIEVESNFSPWAMRFEPRSKMQVSPYQFAKLLNISVPTEETAQRCSWGLGQVMGATARWLGFHGALPQLCDPETGIFWMAEYFEKSCMRYKTMEEQISAYNAGSVNRAPDGKFWNQTYVDRVLKAYGE